MVTWFCMFTGEIALKLDVAKCISYICLVLLCIPKSIDFFMTAASFSFLSSRECFRQKLQKSLSLVTFCQFIGSTTHFSSSLCKQNHPLLPVNSVFVNETQMTCSQFFHFVD